MVRNSIYVYSFTDYLFNYQPCPNGESSINNLDCYPNIKRLTSKSNFQSINKKVDEWHIRSKKLEVGELKQYKYPRINLTVNDVDFEIIHTNHECATESIEMDHCILTYNQRMLNRDYIAFRVNGFDERATLGAFVEHQEDRAVLKFNQCHGKRNKQMPEKIISACHALIQQINSENIIMSNYLIELQESVEQHEKLFKLEFTPELDEFDLEIQNAQDECENYIFF